MTTDCRMSTWKPKFVPIKGTRSASPSQEMDVIRVVSYNILAQVYVKSVFFPHSPSACLRWKVRSQAILECLLSFRADFLCLQELDEYESFYKGKMEVEGYSSVYVKRTGKKKDGCGIFFRSERFELVSNVPIYYNDLAPHVGDIDDEATTLEATSSSDEGKETANTEERGDPNDPKVRLKRDCVGILAAFRVSHAPDKLIVLVNTHLYWDPDWADVKLAQAEYLVSRVLEFQSMLQGKFQYPPPVIICGDFNSTPGDQVYCYLTSGVVGVGSPLSDPLMEIQSFGGRRKIPEFSLPETVLSGNFSKGEDEVAARCPLPLYSVYASVQEEPAFTNCTPDFTGTLDYIYFSSLEHLKPVSLLELPSSASSEVLGGLPNYSHPSDHLPIGTDILILDKL